MTRALSRSERIAASPGGFGPRHGGTRNHPSRRAAFDAWLEETRGEREALASLNDIAKGP